MSRAGRAAGLILAVLAMDAATVWGALALFYLAPGPEWVRIAAAVAFAVLGQVAVAALVSRRWRRAAVPAFAAAFALPLLAFFSAKPSNDREWETPVAVLPYADIQGDHVTLHNIRNFDYRTETDFTPAYYDKTYDLRKLDRVDLVASYFMGELLAHIFLSFGFGEEHLAISIEVRTSKSRPYGTLPGFFRQYELVYVVADERDVIRVRTNYRKNPVENVYLYRLTGPIDRGRRVFLDYLRDINALREHPRFYNTVTTNCTTMILAHSAVNPGHLGYSWKVLVTGYAPEYAYEAGRLDQSLSYPELKQRSHINAVAQAADRAPDFSQRIRVGLP